MTPQISSVIFLVIKIFILVGIGLYTLFGAVLIRQEQLMANVLEESFEPILRLLVILHFAAAVGLFILALFIL
ncbi:hypothetical protein HY409_01660 [Candidatus Gottesmanbacteria bacterium]|nr:hypothetical protein [Candidatus Gottesmanbacteria bacterium]